MISTNVIVLYSLYSPIQVPFFSTEVENKKIKSLKINIFNCVFDVMMSLYYYS